MAGWTEPQIELLIEDISKDSKLEKNGALRVVCEKMIRGGYQLVNKEYQVASTETYFCFNEEV